ncbi:nucleotidyltransferase [Rhodohalobacter sp. SW132]|uniref:nucleotidyltransferase family protein n=1 Tax=Rhodohalobacter sp. SW132 TaxID=2293433 RepID=UPI000E27BAD5|nr:nucleotidyltransferase family protein [Rhodohalobacter sp. SW132]REL38347.1 nucleotidyltransferase [Rhodohalobacter sp. SW132]
METAILEKKDILQKLQQLRSEFNKFGVKRIGLFGSFVRNSQTPNSDIDILVEFDQGKKSFDNFMQLSFVLDEALPYPVELVTKESLSPYLAPKILHEVEYVTNSD